MPNLAVCHLLRDTEKDVAGAVHDDIHLTKMGACSVYYSADIGGVCLSGQDRIATQVLAVLCLEIVQLFQFTSRASYPIATLQKMLRQDATKSHY